MRQAAATARDPVSGESLGIAHDSETSWLYNGSRDPSTPRVVRLPEKKGARPCSINVFRLTLRL